MIVAPGPVDEVRDTVAEALQRQVAVSFTYKAPDAAPTTRTVDPVKVHIADGQWYLQGWCHLRQAMRTFHLDRVSDLELTDIPITHGEEPVPGWFDADAGDVVARIRFPAVRRAAARRLPRPRRGRDVGRRHRWRRMRVADELQPAAPRGPPRRRRRDPRARRRATRGRRMGRGRTRPVPLSRRVDFAARAARAMPAGYTEYCTCREDITMLREPYGWHLLIILAVILLLFGAAKLPALAKSMGQSARVFKGEMKAMKDEDAAAAARRSPPDRSFRLRRGTGTGRTRRRGRNRRHQVLTAVATAGPPRIEDPNGRGATSGCRSGSIWSSCASD